MAEPLIEVRGLVNRFGAQVVHDHLDMTVEQGEVFGIVGGSGSGKSVLLRSILGLQRPQAGEVRMLGRDLTQLTDRRAQGNQGDLWRHVPAGRAVFLAHSAAERAVAHARAPAPVAARARRAGPAQGAAGRSVGRGRAQISRRSSPAA